MYKRSTTLLAIIIVISLMFFPLAIATEYEFTVYEKILMILTTDEIKSYIGEPEYYTSDQSNGICWTFFDADYGTISLVGEDIYGKAHCMFWNNLSYEDVSMACEVLCMLWDVLEENAESYGHGLAFNFISEDRGQYIFSLEDANSFLGR